MKRENILISEDPTTKRVSATKFTAPGDIPAFDCSIHFGKEGNDITLQNCNIEDNALVKCSPDDTYDFETGALISLMKMCGREKVIKACDELYRDDNYKNALQEMTEKNEKLMKENNYLKYTNSCRESAIESLENTRDLLINKNNELIEENENLKKRINELESYNAQLEDEVKIVRDAHNMCEHKYQDLKAKKVDLVYTNYKLKVENEKLKLDCEKLQHGYNDMIFCGGRACGKQYKALVELFKKIPKETIQAAYVTAYKESLIWCTSQPSIRDFLDKQVEQINKLTVDSLIEESRAFTRKCVDEWLYGPPTKREQMWDNILNASQDPPVDIKVAKQDITSFLRELQDHFPKAMWNGSACLPTEYINPHWFEYDYIYFALFRYVGKGDLRICYDECKHTWINKPVIDYLPPMRWDLFKKGRIAVRLTKDNYKEFYDICEKELGRSPSYKPDEFAYAPMEKFVLRYDKKFKGYIFLGSTESKKIVNWEDVR